MRRDSAVVRQRPNPADPAQALVGAQVDERRKGEEPIGAAAQLQARLLCEWHVQLECLSGWGWKLGAEDRVGGLGPDRFMPGLFLSSNVGLQWRDRRVWEGI
jgi:hypothetical protein